MDITITIQDELVPVLQAFMATQQVQTGIDDKTQQLTYAPKYVDETDLCQQNLADGLFTTLLNDKQFASASPTIAAAQQAVDDAIAQLDNAKAIQVSKPVKTPPITVPPAQEVTP